MIGSSVGERVLARLGALRGNKRGRQNLYTGIGEGGGSRALLSNVEPGPIETHLNPAMWGLVSTTEGEYRMIS